MKKWPCFSVVNVSRRSSFFNVSLSHNSTTALATFRFLHFSFPITVMNCFVPIASIRTGIA
ncbi:hypothetical protein PENTCL1PPCAC_19606, partial [Pristionchus entomophagus]